MNILFVENHAVFAETVVASFLEEHHVEVVPSVGAARDAIAARRFDAVLVDYDLDDVAGDNLVRELAVVVPRPVIIGVSSHADGNAALLRAGADTICPKLEFANIGTVLEQAVDHAVETSRSS